MPNQNFFSDFSSVVDKITSQYENFICFGDFNFDMSDKAKGSTISDLCDIFDLTNLLKNPTCFTHILGKPSTLDLILANKPSLCGKTCNFSFGLNNQLIKLNELNR